VGDQNVAEGETGKGSTVAHNGGKFVELIREGNTPLTCANRYVHERARKPEGAVFLLLGIFELVTEFYGLSKKEGMAPIDF